MIRANESRLRPDFRFGAQDPTRGGKTAYCCGCYDPLPPTGSIFCYRCVAAARAVSGDSGAGRGDSLSRRPDIPHRGCTLGNPSTWLALDVPLLPKATAHFPTIQYMAATKRGRAVLSPRQLKWARSQPRWPDPIKEPKTEKGRRKPVVVKHVPEATHVEDAGHRCDCGRPFKTRQEYRLHMATSDDCRKTTRKARATERKQAAARSVFDTCLPSIVRQSRGFSLRAGI